MAWAKLSRSQIVLRWAQKPGRDLCVCFPLQATVTAFFGDPDLKILGMPKVVGTCKITPAGEISTTVHSILSVFSLMIIKAVFSVCSLEARCVRAFSVCPDFFENLD